MVGEKAVPHVVVIDTHCISAKCLNKKPLNVFVWQLQNSGLYCIIASQKIKFDLRSAFKSVRLKILCHKVFVTVK